MATPDEVKKALMSVMPLFANYKPPASPKEVEIFTMAWHRQVGHLPSDILAAALADAAGKTGFFPTPKEVLDSVVTLSTPASISGEEAWGKVVKCILEFGYIRPPFELVAPEDQPNVREPWTFADKKTLEVVKQMGWRRLCLEEDETLQWQFIHAYKALTERTVTAIRELPAVTDTRRQIAAQQEMARLTAQLAAPISKPG